MDAPDFVLNALIAPNNPTTWIGGGYAPGSIITYGFLQSFPTADYENRPDYLDDYTGFTSFSPAQIQAFRQILALIEQVCDLHFQEVTNNPTGAMM